MNISDRRRGGWLGAPVAVAALLVAFSVPMDAATIKLATLSPDGSVWITLLREAGEKIEQETAGRVELKIYPGGVMGDDPTVMRKMRIGQLQAAILTTGSFGKIFSDAQLYNLPMQFASFEEVDYVRERGWTAMLRQGLEDSGFICPGLAEVGMAYAMSTRPVRSINDTSGIRFWTPSRAMSGPSRPLRRVRHLPGAVRPSRMSSTGLQTGLIDAVATPLVGALALQWHNQLDYILDLPFMYIYARDGAAGTVVQAARRRRPGDRPPTARARPSAPPTRAIAQTTTPFGKVLQAPGARVHPAFGGRRSVNGRPVPGLHPSTGWRTAS